MADFNNLDCIYIKIKNNGAIEFIKIMKHSANEFKYEDFLTSVANVMNISAYEISHLTDSEGTSIPEEMFLQILKQNYSHPQFYLNIILKGSAIESRKSVLTPARVEKQNARVGLDMYISCEELRTFIVNSENSYVLRKAYINNAATVPLKDVERRAIIREAVNFLLKKFGWYPENNHKCALAEALIQIFPQLKSSENGIELLFNNKTNSGFIATRIYNVRNKARLTDNVRKRKSKSQETEETSVTSNVQDEEDILILKNCNVDSQLELIKRKLKQTLNARLLAFDKNEFTQISKQFPFFFLKPELILYDFSLRFPSHSEGLVENWETFSLNIEAIFNDCATQNLEESTLISEWFPSVKLMFLLVKLLPQTAAGKSSSKITRDRYIESLNKLIIFKAGNLTIEELIDNNLQNPYIIAVGANKTAISNYYICVERELFSLPNEFNFVQVLDCFFKSHYVFHQHFPPSLKNFWDFITLYVYKIEQKYKVSNRVMEIISKFDQKLYN